MHSERCFTRLPAYGDITAPMKIREYVINKAKEIVMDKTNNICLGNIKN